MSDNKNAIMRRLHTLGLDTDEAKLYMELLREPNTHLVLSRRTGIARTKVYRLVELLEKRSLVTKRTDEQGTLLTASSPTKLEVAILNKEEELRQERQALQELPALLTTLQKGEPSPFIVHTYEGVAGLKQMCWHELQAKGELLSLGGQTVEDLISSRYWAEKHRQRTVEAGYTIREIINADIDLPTFTANKTFMKQYAYRQLPYSFLPFDDQTVIYNDTVAIYHWRKQQKVGVEIINKPYATMMRHIFEHFWAQAAKPLQPNGL